MKNYCNYQTNAFQRTAILVYFVDFGNSLNNLDKVCYMRVFGAKNLIRLGYTTTIIKRKDLEFL